MSESLGGGEAKPGAFASAPAWQQPALAPAVAPVPPPQPPPQSTPAAAAASPRQGLSWVRRPVATAQQQRLQHKSPRAGGWGRQAPDRPDPRSYSWPGPFTQAYNPVSQPMLPPPGQPSSLASSQTQPWQAVQLPPLGAQAPVSPDGHAGYALQYSQGWDMPQMVPGLTSAGCVPVPASWQGSRLPIGVDASGRAFKAAHGWRLRFLPKLIKLQPDGRPEWA